MYPGELLKKPDAGCRLDRRRKRRRRRNSNGLLNILRRERNFAIISGSMSPDLERSQVAFRGDGLKIWRVAANILNIKIIEFPASLFMVLKKYYA